MLKTIFKKQKKKKKFNYNKFTLDDINLGEQAHKDFKTTMFLVFKEAN